MWSRSGGIIEVAVGAGRPEHAVPGFPNPQYVADGLHWVRRLFFDVVHADINVDYRRQAPWKYFLASVRTLRKWTM